MNPNTKASGPQALSAVKSIHLRYRPSLPCAIDLHICQKKSRFFSPARRSVPRKRLNFDMVLIAISKLNIHTLPLKNENIRIERINIPDVSAKKKTGETRQPNHR